MLDEASWRPRTHYAQRIVKQLSIEELGGLPVEIRVRLQGQLNCGSLSSADQKAIAKILMAGLIEFEYQRGMIIKGTPDFVAQTRLHLANVASTSMGKRLLQSLSASGKKVTIVPTSGMNQALPDYYPGALAKGTVLRWKDSSGRMRAIKGQGIGSDTTIKYNPNRLRIGSTEAWQQPPPGIWLAHELIHASDAACGIMDPEEVDGIRNYERQAIGLPPYDQKDFTENKLRLGWKEPQPARLRY